MLVNNAGSNIPEPFLDVSEAHLDFLLTLNVKSMFVVAQAAGIINNGVSGYLKSFVPQVEQALGRLGQLRAVQVTPPSPFTFELPEASVTLGRYQHVDFPIVVARTRGFTAPLTFRLGTCLMKTTVIQRFLMPRGFNASMSCAA